MRRHRSDPSEAFLIALLAFAGVGVLSILLAAGYVLSHLRVVWVG